MDSINIGKEEPLWVVNFKRGLASQLQLQLDDSSGVFIKQELKDYYAENTYYQVIEATITSSLQLPNKNLPSCGSLRDP